MSKRLLSFSRLLDLPENLSARVAVRYLADVIASDCQAVRPNPLFLHGPAGVGKTCLVKTLQAEVLHSAMRFSLSPMLTEEEIAEAARRIMAVVGRLRRMKVQETE